MEALFPGLVYGALRVRPVLRAWLEPGEMVVGWGPARVNPSLGGTSMRTALALVPGIGPVLALLLAGDGGSGAGLAILTDRRLLLLRSGALAKEPAKAVRRVLALNAVRVEALRRGSGAGASASPASRFRVVEADGKGTVLELPRGRTRPAARLYRGLMLLADARPAPAARRGREPVF